jgi:hypothetical protein
LHRYDEAVARRWFFAVSERGAIVACVAMLALGSCLSAFAPTVVVRREHAGVRPTSPSHECMACHVGEHEVLPAGAHASAPVVADWMIEDRRGCLSCHGVRGAR